MEKGCVRGHRNVCMTVLDLPRESWQLDQRRLTIILSTRKTAWKRSTLWRSIDEQFAITIHHSNCVLIVPFYLEHSHLATLPEKKQRPRKWNWKCGSTLQPYTTAWWLFGCCWKDCGIFLSWLKKSVHFLLYTCERIHDWTWRPAFYPNHWTKYICVTVFGVEKPVGMDFFNCKKIQTSGYKNTPIYSDAESV